MALVDAIRDGATWHWERATDTFEVVGRVGPTGVVIRSAPLSELASVLPELDVRRLRRALRAVLDEVSDEFTIRSSIGAAPDSRTLILRGSRGQTSGSDRVLGSIELPGEPVTSDLQAVLDTLSANVAVLDRTGHISAVNGPWREFARLAGVEREWVGTDYIAPCVAGAADDPTAATVVVGLRELLDGHGDALELDYPCHHAGVERWFNLRAVATGAGAARQLVVQHAEITDLVVARTDAMQARKALGDTEQAADIGSFVQHGDARVAVTPTLLALLGRDQIVRIGEIVSAFPPSERRALARGLRAARAGTAWRGTHCLRGRTVHVLLTPIHTGERVIGVRGVVQLDATPEIRSLRELLHRMVENISECVFSVDRAGRISDANSVACDLLRYPRAQLIGRDLVDTVVLATYPDRGPDMQSWILTQPDGAPEGPSEAVFVRSDGVAIPVSLVVMPHDAGATAATVVFADITDRKQEERARAEQLEQTKWTRRVRDALRDERFVLYAQPIVEIEHGEQVQRELLIRMLDTRGNLVGPASFLPAAEQSGLIRDVDIWVTKQAVSLAVRGHAVHLNLSAASLCDGETTRAVEQAIVSSGGAARRIVVELTETAVLSDERRALAFASRLVDLGVEIALDDFGTGYGGFTYLKKLPISYLKIDREFVRDLPTSAASLSVVEATVQLARSFGIRTIAEGVESNAAWEVLRASGVDFAQGYLFSRPRPISELGSTS